MLFIGTYPSPDGTIGAVDKPHIAWMYSGITLSTGVVAVAQTAIEEIIFKSPFYTSVSERSKLGTEMNFESPFSTEVSEKSRLR